MNTQREQLIQTWLQATLQTDQFEINFWLEMRAFVAMPELSYKTKHICSWMRHLKKRLRPICRD